jgi:SNF2 family DNA or RNA helicase
MPKLTDHSWKAKYTPDNTANIVEAFYIPALQCARRYWRTTGYFQATALAMALRGIEGLIQNQGQMRMIVGCTLDQKELDAIQKGMDLRTVVDNYFAKRPLEPPNDAVRDALELLAWMVQHNVLDIKIALVCDNNKQPVGGTRIFHEKTGIIEDAEGNRIAFTGGVNETPQGWRWNWDSIHVHSSWKTAEHVDEDEISFSRLWNDQASNALVTDIPNAVRNDLLRFAPPADEFPTRLKEAGATYNAPPIQPEPEAPPADYTDPRTIVWSYITQAPKLDPDGECVGEATSAITPWPHQVRAFKRMWDNWPPKLLIADEVGLGKTIQAGLVLRQAWMSGKAKRILVMAPASVLKQWQIELREKFNLNWPIYDGKALHWYPSPGFQGPLEKSVSRETWHQEPVVLVSSHLMRRRDRVPELLEQAEPWDLIILDEAHHARRSGGMQSGNLTDKRPNRLLSLMQSLKYRTQGLVLLTATPMQVDPIEVWDLLQLLGMSPEWNAVNFLRFFEIAGQTAPSHEDMAYLARMFRAIERDHGSISDDVAKRLPPRQSKMKAKKILRALRDGASIPLRQMETKDREAAIRIVQAHTPVKVLISRHTRELLREYYKAGKLSTPIATRKVEDEFIILSDAERKVYDAVEDYISTTYNNAASGDRNAVGFVMTIYRRRLASSFYALAQTLEGRLAKLKGDDHQLSTVVLEEDLPDEFSFTEEIPDVDEAAELEKEALNLEESADLRDLLVKVRDLPTDSKACKLEQLFTQLKQQGYRQVIVFTQFTDTMDFLRQELASSLGCSIMCFSGRGGEIQERDGTWRTINREDTKRRFRNQEAEILLCTDAAAEGLNFQFCGAFINYDMPWNPMRVEQRIGRIDRLGQAHSTIRIYNLHYEDTVETDVYMALRDRIDLFETFVGRLQPILARLTGAITNLALTRREDRERERTALLSQLEEDTDGANQQSFDLDTVTAEDLEEPIRPKAAYTLADLQKVLNRPELLPPGITVKYAGQKDFSYLRPGMTKAIRVTTDPEFYDENSDSVEFWSPGSPLFPDGVEGLAKKQFDYEDFQRALQ